jgi:hypothetical protein
MKHSYATVTDQLIERLIGRIDFDGPPPAEPQRPVDGGCWLWQGGLIPAGYGSISVGNVTHMVHRVVYEACVEPIPSGADLDHICRVRSCCNPDHTEPVTRQENILRTRRPTCRRGHAMTPENTGPVKGHPHQRICRICAAEKTRRFRARKCNA